MADMVPGTACMWIMDHQRWLLARTNRNTYKMILTNITEPQRLHSSYGYACTHRTWYQYCSVTNTYQPGLFTNIANRSCLFSLQIDSDEIISVSEQEKQQTEFNHHYSH